MPGETFEELNKFCFSGCFLSTTKGFLRCFCRFCVSLLLVNVAKWIRKIKKTDIRRAKRFSNTFRFINDLKVLNDDGDFERSFRKIYSPELELQKESDLWAFKLEITGFL